MKDSLEDFEKGLRSRLKEFNDTKPTRRPRPPGPDVGARSGFVVTLAVRAKRLSPDTVFVHESRSISRLEAQIEAEKAAREAGWPIVGYVVSIENRAREGAS